MIGRCTDCKYIKKNYDPTAKFRYHCDKKNMDLNNTYVGGFHDCCDDKYPRMDNEEDGE